MTVVTIIIKAFTVEYRSKVYRAEDGFYRIRPDMGIKGFYRPEGLDAAVDSDFFYSYSNLKNILAQRVSGGDDYMGVFKIDCYAYECPDLLKWA